METQLPRKPYKNFWYMIMWIDEVKRLRKPPQKSAPILSYSVLKIEDV
jgi:hypothetical protein